MFSMHTAHLANVSKSVTKNATFPKTGGLPCLIIHSCMSAASPTVVGGLIFCISGTPQLGSLFPLFHGPDTPIANFPTQHYLLYIHHFHSLNLVLFDCKKWDCFLIHQFSAITKFDSFSILRLFCRNKKLYFYPYHQNNILFASKEPFQYLHSQFCPQKRHCMHHL